MTGTSVSPHRLPARCCAALAGVICVLALAAPAGAAAPASPRTTLVRLEGRLRAMAHAAQTSGPHRAATAAAAGLARATAPALWINGRQIVAPAYGETVFTGLAAAVADLRHLSGRAVHGARSSIAAAAQDLAATVVGQAVGGDPARVAAAGQALAAGRGQAARGAFPAAIRSDERAWLAAFAALTGLVTGQVTHVPSAALTAAALDALGSKTIGLAGPRIMHGLPPLTRTGKPELFFGGAEGCPFCAIERWGIVVALSQFGTFSHLSLMQSDTIDRPAVPTLTFLGSSYQSPWLSFVPVELLSNVRRRHGWVHLQRPPAAEAALLRRFDPPGQTPFIDVANRFIQVGSTAQPPLVAGLSWSALGNVFGDPVDVPAQAIGGEAEVTTAEICEATGGNPSAVCSTPVVRQYETALPLLNGKGGGCPLGQPAPADRRRGGGPRARPARCII